MKTLIAAFIILVSAMVISFSFKKKYKEAENESKGFAVIELFTSEGCSSCPPADALAEEIQKKYKDENVLVLGYHVDYWDRLGWKDPFSSADHTKRQNYYAGVFNLNSIYTPQVVVNGETEFVGSNRSKLLNAITQNLKEKTDTKINLKTAVNASGKISVEYSTGSKNSAEEQLVLLLVQKMATNKIKRGENEGRTLHHINIVRAISYLPISTRQQTSTFSFPGGLKKEDVFIAAFIQNKKTGEINALETSAIE